MEERLDDITFALASGVAVVIPWEARQPLLARLQRVQSAANLRTRLEAVGPSDSVELTLPDQRVLLRVLTAWVRAREAGIPEWVLALRDALADDWYDAS